MITPSEFKITHGSQIVGKTILTPEQCLDLIPHWPEIDIIKRDKLSKRTTRISKFLNGQKHVVLSSPAIIIDRTGYIINGKHRAITAVISGRNLEAWIVENSSDIRHHLPQSTWGETGLEGCIDALENKATYIAHCNTNGVRSIRDLIKKMQESKNKDD